MQAFSETDPSANSARGGTGYALLGWVLVSAMHVTILTAGLVWPVPSYSAYYNRQADAFARGQTHLILRPPPGLAALSDPYDPDANRRFRQGIGIHDAVLFGGKFYLYWGPVPALALTAVKAVTGPGIIGDEWLVLAFTLGTTLLVSLILRDLWRRQFPDQSPRWILIGVFLFGLATPVTFFLARAAVYEAAIAGGQFFLLAAIWLLMRTPSPSYSGERAGVRGGASTGADQGNSRGELAQLTSGPSPQPSPPSTRERGQCARLFLGGLCLSLAVGCRASLAVAAVGLGLLVGVNLARKARWRQLVLFAIPLIAGAVALASFNLARFGSVTEFGQKYQLTGANYRTTPALFSPANALPSTWSYLLRLPEVQTTFPFVTARGGEGTFPAWISRPAFYESKEAIVGLLVSVPLILLAMLPIIQALRRRIDGWAVALLLISGALAFAPVLLAIGSTQRYLMDLWPCVAILTTMGIWIALDRGTAMVRGGVALMLAWTIGLGLLFAASGYYDHLKTWNPPLYRQLGGE